MADPPVMAITAILEHGEADQGQQLGIKIRDRQGTEAVILIPKELESEFLVTLCAASEHAAKTRSSYTTSEIAMALQVQGTQMVKAEDGSVLLRCKLKNRMNLDLSLDQKARDQIREIVDKADQLDAFVERPKRH